MKAEREVEVEQHNYIKELGYGDPSRFVFKITAEEDGDDEIPKRCHVLARWSNHSVTAHFNVQNSVAGFFEAFDEVGDPSGVVKVWCCDVDAEDYLDTDADWSIDWPLRPQTGE